MIMGMFDSILGQVDSIAAKVGLPADTVKSAAESLQTKLGEGGDKMAALTDVAAQHGISVDKLKEMLGTGEGSILGKVTGFLDKDGDGQVMDDLTDMAKGLFGKK
jgi:hypothetical protein